MGSILVEEIGSLARMTALRALALSIVVVGCGSSNSGNPGDDDDGPAPDAKVFMDAPGTVPSMINFSGTATETGFSGTSPVDGVAVAAFAKTDETTPLATGTTDGQGNYTLQITLDGAPFDGFIKATKSGYVDLYLYATGPVSSDFSDGSFNMITPSNMNALNNIANGGQQAGKGLIGLGVLDANNQPVAGATVSSTPASGNYRYMGSNGFPSSTEMATGADGVAFMFSVPAGEVMVTASKSGMTFRAHPVKARPDTFTSTVVTP
jgi:hypothetical protein